MFKKQNIPDSLRSKEQHLFEIQIFCYNVNVFNFFDQFNASLLNKSIHLTDHNLLNGKVQKQTLL